MMRAKLGMISRSGLLGDELADHRHRPQNSLPEEIPRLGRKIRIDDPKPAVALIRSVPIMEEEDPVHPVAVPQTSHHVLVILELISFPGLPARFGDPDGLVLYSQVPDQSAEGRWKDLVSLQLANHLPSGARVIVVV